MRISNDLTFPQDPLRGPQPEIKHGTSRPTDDPFFTKMAVGSTYYALLTENQLEEYHKVKHESRGDDFLLVRGSIAQRFELSDFTDGGSATGTANVNGLIPEGALYQRTFLYNVINATGESTLTIQVGESDTPDVDRYTTGTPSVATAATEIDAGVPSGTAYHAAAITPIVTLTEDSDFGDLTGLGFTLVMTYTGAAL